MLESPYEDGTVITLASYLRSLSSHQLNLDIVRYLSVMAPTINIKLVVSLRNCNNGVTQVIVEGEDHEIQAVFWGLRDKKNTAEIA